MREINLANSELKGLVDNEDYERVIKYKWYLIDSKKSNTKYIIGKAPKTIGLHNFIMKNSYIDHENNNGLDNRKDNLRPCTHQQNCQNKETNKNSISGYKGVTKSGNRWRVMITTNEKLTTLGSYKYKEEAAIIYDLVALYYFKSFANLNFKQSYLLKPLSIKQIKDDIKITNKNNNIFIVFKKEKQIYRGDKKGIETLLHLNRITINQRIRNKKIINDIKIIKQQ